MDVLGDVLLTTRLLATTIGVIDAATPWGLDIPSQPPHVAMCATLIDGPMWMESPSHSLVEMQPGDTVVCLRGSGHRSMSSPSASATPFFAFLTAHGVNQLSLDRQHDLPFHLKWGDGADRTRFLSFAVIAQDGGASSILAHLPATLLIRANQGRPTLGVSEALAFLTDDKARPGHKATAARLVELIFTSAVREYILAAPTIEAGWMRGLRDPRIGRAIECIHGRPEAPWSVASLASEARMGRSTFARHFQKLLGEAPIDYLIGHRMQLACERLSKEKRSVAAVASSLGYSSERAFRHAFRSRMGMAPKQYCQHMAREYLAEK